MYFSNKSFLYIIVVSAHARYYMEMANIHKQHVVLLGHSFVRRLRDFMDSSDQHYNLRLNETLFDITCRVQGGLTIPRLIHERKDLYNFTHACPNAYKAVAQQNHVLFVYVRHFHIIPCMRTNYNNIKFSTIM
jgi:hypothetical protein